jgi:hypothetical protein
MKPAEIMAQTMRDALFAEVGDGSPHALYERARARYNAQTTVDADADFEAGVHLCGQLMAEEIDGYAARLMAAVERQWFAPIEGVNRNARRRVQRHRKDMQAGVRRLVQQWRRSVQQGMRHTIDQFDSAEDDFARLMTAALED